MAGRSCGAYVAFRGLRNDTLFSAVFDRSYPPYSRKGTRSLAQSIPMAYGGEDCPRREGVLWLTKEEMVIKKYKNLLKTGNKRELVT
jgi:hypothetical protein